MRIDLARASITNAAGAVVLRATGSEIGDGAWRVLDRSPVSARLARGDGAVCRFEMVDSGLLAEIVGGAWSDQPASIVTLDAEVRDGNVAAQDRT